MDAATLLPRLIQAAGKGPDAVLREVEAPLQRIGFHARRTEAAPHAVLWTRGAPRLLLSGHVDVVPVGEGWRRDPHGGEVADERIWGRGACDMLGAVACFVGAAARTPRAPCAILLTSDEETGMMAAPHALAEGLVEGFEGVVVGEPTGFQVGIAEKGVLWLRLRTEGRNAHGSMPELGDNAAERLVRCLALLADVKVPGAEHALLGRPTRNLGRLFGGEAVNQVPASAAAELDIRYLPGTTQHDVVHALTDALQRGGEKARFEVISHHPPFETSPAHPLVETARRAVAGARGDAPPLVGLPYGTEASKFAPHGIPSIILGPGEAGLAHTNRESILLDALAEGERVYAALLDAYAERAA